MKKINIKQLVVATVLSLLGVFGLGGKAMAAGRAISLSPTSQRIVLVPGETYIGGFAVANSAGADSDLHYIATASSFSQFAGENSKDDYGEVDFETTTDMNAVVDWTTLYNATGTVAPNEQATVSYRIDVPYDAPAGGQYMAILVREDSEFKEDASMGITEVMQMAFIVYAEVAGETRQEGQILENNIPSLLLSGDLQATSMVEDSGNVHTFAEYVLQVWPMGSDEEICTNEEDPSSEFVMPNSKKYHVESCELPLVGIFNAKQTVTIFGETSVVEKMVIKCPVWILFVVLFVVIAAIAWLVMRSKKRKNARR